MAKPAKVADAGAALYVAKLWREARPVAGTRAERYLAARGLVGPYPPALRYLERCKHTDAGQWLPALVAAVTVWPSCGVAAIHRTYLALDGSGKADVNPAKKALGPIRGGAVRLAAPGPVLAVGEGIETMLSVAQATGLPCWAVLGASNLHNLVLPPLPLAAEAVIAADRDEAGVTAAQRAAAVWVRQGRAVRIVLPPAGCSDFNDVLTRSRVEVAA